MASALVLDGADMVAAGLQREVFVHPLDRTKLIKVLKVPQNQGGRSAFTVITEKWFPSVRIRAIRKEYAEYLRLMLANQQPDFRPPISHMYGFVSTNRGLGCVTEKVSGRDGAMGETLKEIINQNRLSEHHVRLLNRTLDQLYHCNVRASDLTATNLAFGQRDNGTGPGPEECVLVDGFGDIHAIPVRSMARWSNRMGLDDSCKRLARNTGLHWDPKARQFALAC